MVLGVAGSNPVSHPNLDNVEVFSLMAEPATGVASSRLQVAEENLTLVSLILFFEKTFTGCRLQVASCMEEPHCG